MQFDDKLKKHMKRDHARMRKIRQKNGNSHYCRICGISDEEEVLIHYGSVKYCGICYTYKENYARMITEKMCAECREVKPMEEFHVDNSRSDRRYRLCKVCNNKNNKKFRDKQKKLD